MRALVIALALATASCSCSNSVKVTFNYEDEAVAAADSLTITVSIGEMHTYLESRTPGKTQDSVEIEVPAADPRTFQLTVAASANNVTVGSGAGLITVQCPSTSYNIMISPSGTSPPPGDGTHACSSDCGGTGTCAAGSCNTSTGVCEYPSNEPCTTCEAGIAYSSGTCSSTSGICMGDIGTSTACTNSICGDVSCASPPLGLGQIVAGVGFSCVSLGPNNNVRCWGSNAYGVLGSNVGIGGTSAVPVAVPGTQGITSLVAGDDHVCGVLADHMICWGRNQSGQLGVMVDQVAHPTPVTVPDIVPLMAAASKDHTCAIVQTPGTQSQTVYCWGMNYAGEIGEGSGIVIPVSQVSPFLDGSYQSLALGDKHLCVANKATAGFSPTEVTCIGDDSSNQLGNDSPGGFGVVQLTFANVQLSAGGNTTCAFDGGDTPASLYCWGDNSSGQLGVGSSATSSGTPLSLCNSGFINMVDCDRVASVSVGNGYACGSFSNGVSCWGSYADGQLGQLGPAGSDDTNIPVPTLMNGAYVAAGAGHACAIAIVGSGTDASLTVDCWGDNRLGQTGDPIPTHFVDGLLPAPIFWVYDP